MSTLRTTQFRTIAALSAGAAAVTVLGLGGTAQAATPTAAPATASTTTSVRANALHRADLVAALGGTTKGRTSTTVGGISACTGETRWVSVVGHRTGNASAWWHGKTGTGVSYDLSQTVARQPSLASAKSVYRKLVRLNAECQGETGGHWTYGAKHRPAVRGGSAVWMPAVDGDGRTPDGGVIVMRVGRMVTVAEVINPGVKPNVVRSLVQPIARRLR
ncbi:hypothetical protein [Nocardioides sp.]|uniref:hypothetical protein n=1 Tax=Nocardioides sp. TaxID=35761 RepID=UPI002609E006|nr:hypothetical protein [Nocardioides sp.]